MYMYNFSFSHAIQGIVVDGSLGGLTGQLISANYESKGVSLYGFEAVG